MRNGEHKSVLLDLESPGNFEFCVGVWKISRDYGGSIQRVVVVVVQIGAWEFLEADCEDVGVMETGDDDEEDQGTWKGSRSNESNKITFQR